MTPLQKQQVDDLLRDYQGALNDGTEIGTFKLFEAALHLILCETRIQPKHKINFDQISDQITKLEKQGVIEINTSLYLPTISNLVIINKDTSRLSKADKFQRKQIFK